MAKKTTNKLQNPFVYQGYKGPEYFCDRTEETEKLISSLQNGRNITLVAPRKMGKTGLIKHAFFQIKQQNKDAICLYVDIFSTRNQRELVELLWRTVVEETFSKRKTFTSKMTDVFMGLRPTVSPDPLTGAPSFSVSVEPVQAEHTLKGILDYLDSLQKEVYLAIDEFQQIAEYPETGTEALLRSLIQFTHHIGFVFSGSHQHLMAEMFSSPKRPFFQSTQLMGLQPLHEEIYYEFARRFFEAKGGAFDAAPFHRLYERFGGYTWYMQAVLNRLYEDEKRVETEQKVTEAILNVLDTLALQYESMVSFLTNNQFSLLKAVAKAGRVVSPQSNAFIRQYGLPGSSSVKTALDVLLAKDLVCQTPQGYIVSDRFMDLWLKRTF